LATSDHCRCNIPELAFLVWPLADLLVHGIGFSY
jgi:predicted membrane protein